MRGKERKSGAKHLCWQINSEIQLVSFANLQFLHFRRLGHCVVGVDSI